MKTVIHSVRLAIVAAFAALFGPEPTPAERMRRLIAQGHAPSGGATDLLPAEKAAEKLSARRKAWADLLKEAYDPDRRVYDRARIKSVELGEKSMHELIREREAELKDLQTAYDEQNEAEKSAARNAEQIAQLEKISNAAVHPSSKGGGAASDDPDFEGIMGYTPADVKRYKGTTPGIEVAKFIAGLRRKGQLTIGNEYVLDLPAKMVSDLIVRKTTMTTAAGWDPEDIRIDRVIYDEQRPAPVVTDVLPTFPTSMSTVKYMEETTFTNNAAEESENSALGESALAYTERSEEVRKIGHTLPVTDEQLEDVPGLRSILDQRLQFMIRQRLDLQVLVGDGSVPNLSGVHDRSSIGSQALGADTASDAVRKGITLIEVNGFTMPNWAIFHPTDWETIRLEKDANGQYLYGPPSQPGIDRIWGLPVIRTAAQSQGQALIGDFANFSALYVRRGVDVSVTDSHASEFTSDVKRIKMTMRAALAVFRAAAFSEITGL